LGEEDFLAPEEGGLKWVRHIVKQGKLSEVLRQDRNLLLNVGPRGDGSIHPADVAALRAAGERIRRDGFPGSAEGVTIVGAESTTTS